MKRYISVAALLILAVTVGIAFQNPPVFVSLLSVPGQPAQAFYDVGALQEVTPIDYQTYLAKYGTPPFDPTWQSQHWAVTDADPNLPFTYTTLQFDAVQNKWKIGTQTIPGSRARTVNMTVTGLCVGEGGGSSVPCDAKGNQVPIPMRPLLPNERFSNTFAAWNWLVVRTDMSSGLNPFWF